jgi:flagellar biosynthesis GTPase FlhF
MRVVFAIILLLASFAEAKTMDASEKRAFLKAMQSSKFGHNINSDNIMKKLFAKAQLFKRRLNDGNEEAQWDNFGFDVSDYSVKYSGCASVQTYSDDLAEDEDSDTVLTTKRFVVFRLCPTQYCNKYSVSGCTSDYGEYLIDIDDYLDAVSEYYQQKEENYCNYCQPCWDVQQDNQQNGGGRRRLNDQAANEQDDQMNDAQQADNGEQDQMNDDQQADNEEEEDQMNDDQQDQADQEQQDEADQEQQQNQQQCDENACQDSYDVCYQAQGDGQGNEIDIREFLECSAVQVDDDTEYYLAPHCSSDGFTISVGVYSDEECTQFVGNQVSVSDVLGFDLDTDIFKTYFPKDCTSCKESVSNHLLL